MRVKKRKKIAKALLFQMLKDMATVRTIALFFLEMLETQQIYRVYWAYNMHGQYTL